MERSYAPTDRICVVGSNRLWLKLLRINLVIVILSCWLITRLYFFITSKCGREDYFKPLQLMLGLLNIYTEIQIYNSSECIKLINSNNKAIMAYIFCFYVMRSCRNLLIYVCKVYDVFVTGLGWVIAEVTSTLQGLADNDLRSVSVINYHNEMAILHYTQV